MINSAGEAREILNQVDAKHSPCHCNRCEQSVGYLAALQGPEVMALLGYARHSELCFDQGINNIDCECALKEERRRLLNDSRIKAMREALDLSKHIPEINLVNYDEDDVAGLNAKANEICSLQLKVLKDFESLLKENEG